jgi:hypothetical protein
MVVQIQTQPVFQGFGQPAAHCLPVRDGFPLLTTNPYCKNGYGWLNEGECGCVAGSPGWIPDKKGCSIRCMGLGPNDCPNCEKPINWMMVGGIAAVGLVAAYAFLGKK